MTSTTDLRLPWHTHLVDSTAVIDASGDHVASMCGDYEIEETGLLMEERAAFLVLAANSHHTMKEALEEIALGRGPYKMDPHEHAVSVIEAMKEVAIEALSRLTKEI
jgi:hypothetical protein